MNNYNLESYYPAFRYTIFLAENRNNGKEKDLFDFLNSLDYEVIKTIQTIMYIGRDTYFEEKDGTYNYKNAREIMDRQGWQKDKELEVNQMVGKMPLAKYLKDGFKKLNINL